MNGDCFINVLVCQKQQARQRLYVSLPMSKILFEKGLACSYKLSEEENVTFDVR